MGYTQGRAMDGRTILYAFVDTLLESGAVWRSPSGALVPLGPYLYTFFGTPGHPDGTPYVVAGFK